MKNDEEKKKQEEKTKDEAKKIKGKVIKFNKETRLQFHTVMVKYFEETAFDENHALVVAKINDREYDKK